MSSTVQKEHELPEYIAPEDPITHIRPGSWQENYHEVDGEIIRVLPKGVNAEIFLFLSQLNLHND